MNEMNNEELKKASSEFLLTLLAASQDQMLLFATYFKAMRNYPINRGSWHTFKAEVLGNTTDISNEINSLRKDIADLQRVDDLGIRLFFLHKKHIISSLKAKLEEYETMLDNEGKTNKKSKSYGARYKEDLLIANRIAQQCLSLIRTRGDINSSE